MPGRQAELAQAVFALGKPTVLVLFSGRPLEMRALSARADAVLEAWFPGSEGGHAVVDLLYGDRLPEGRLTMSVPYTVGQVPVYYNGYRTGRPIDKEFSDQRYLSRYIDIPNAPLYPFGYGLGYSPVSYGDTAVEPARENEAWTVSAEIANEGRYPVRETVQLYTRDVSGSVVRPVPGAEGFSEGGAAAGPREKTVRFTLTKEQLAFAHADGSPLCGAGRISGGDRAGRRRGERRSHSACDKAWGQHMNSFYQLNVTEKDIPFVLFYDNGNSVVPSHWHKEIEIIYSLQGSTQMMINDRIFVVREGDVGIATAATCILPVFAEPPPEGGDVRYGHIRGRAVARTE